MRRVWIVADPAEGGRAVNPTYLKSLASRLRALSPADTVNEKLEREAIAELCDQVAETQMAIGAMRGPPSDRRPRANREPRD
jgi:hypothetical protein